MKLKFLPIALLALSFTACDTYEETDDVAKQRAEQEALVKAENLKDAYNEYAQAFQAWNNASNEISTFESKINAYKNGLIYLETGYDEAAEKAMIESEKAGYEAELTEAKARLAVLETAGTDVEALNEEIEAKKDEINDLVKAESNFTITKTYPDDNGDGIDETYTSLYNFPADYGKAYKELVEWKGQKYHNDIYLVSGKGRNVAVWEAYYDICKQELEDAIEPAKEDLDSANEELAKAEEALPKAKEVYEEAKTAFEDAKAAKGKAEVARDDAETARDDVQKTKDDAQTAFNEDGSAANQTALDKANANLDDANTDLNDAQTALNETQADLNDAQAEYNTEIANYEAARSNYNNWISSQNYYTNRYNEAVEENAAYDKATLKTELEALNAAYVAAYDIMKQIEVLSAEKAELENTMFFVEANYGDVSATDSYLNENIETLEYNIASLERNIVSFDRDLAQIEAGLYKMDEGFFRMSKDYYDEEFLTATQLHEQINIYEAKLAAANEVLAAAKAQLDAAKAAYEAFLAQ